MVTGLEGMEVLRWMGLDRARWRFGVGEASGVWIRFHRGTEHGLDIMFTVRAMNGRGDSRIFTLNRWGREFG